MSQAFHVSTAALDTAQVKGNEDIQVLLTSDNNTFLLCTLNKERIPQCPLDLNFAEGDKISFSIKGEGLVHLTGFLIPDDDFMNDLDDEEEEETNDVANAKPAKGKKQQPQELANNKKQAKKVEQEADSDDDEEDDDTFNLEDAEADSDAEEGESDDEEAGEEGDSDDDDDTEEGAEEEASGDDDDDDDDSDEEPEQPKKKAKLDEKAKQNGLENGQASKKEKNKENQQGGAQKILPGGVQITDLKVGAGPEAKPGKKVQVYYEGRLKTNNKIFDSTKSGAGFKFNLGRGEVIKGWDIGVSGMKVGGKRRIVCPPNVAYGPKGSPPVIPPNSTLVFDVELKNVH